MSEELWYVKLANGDVHRVTLDQLDGAFQAGHIDENTMVLAAGASTWSKLGDLAGIDDESSAPANEGLPLPQAPAPQPAPTYAPPPVAARPAVVAAPTAVYAPAYTAPTAARPVMVAAPPPAYPANSLRPLSLDLSDVDLDAPFRRSTGKRAAVVLLGIAAVAGGVGVAAQQGRLNFGHGGSELSNVAAAAAMAAPPAAADPVVAPPVVAPPAVATAAPGTQTHSATAGDGSPLNPQFTTRFNEDTKQKLVAADKTRDQKAKARHVGGAPTSGSKSKSTSFTTGGSKFDPLNSSI